MLSKATGYFLFVKLKQEKREKKSQCNLSTQKINTGLLISKTPAPKLQTSTLILHLMLHSSWEPGSAGRLS